MEKEVKFTTDGRKVLVHGSLNSQEKIVQEIYVVGGKKINLETSIKGLNSCKEELERLEQLNYGIS